MTDVSVEDVEVSLAGERVLKNVTAKASGVFVGIVGPNGAGKTTLLRTMNGVAEPDDGVALVGGDDISGLSSREAARRVATVPQNTDVSFEFSVEEVVRMGRHPHASRFGSGSSDAVYDAMERTDVMEFADRSVHEVSGGERQRVLLARCLAQDTDVLLLDEPTASLDAARAVETLSLVLSLVDEGRTAVAAIHDLSLAARFCDELVLLNDGEVVSSGLPSDVLTEENIEEVFGAPARVEHDSVTGSPRVTALEPEPDESAADGGACPRVHYVGDRTETLRALEGSYDVSVGVVPEGCAVVEESKGEVVTSEPFAPVGDETRRSAVRLADSAVAVVRDGVGTLPETTTPTVEAGSVECVVDAVEEIRNRE